MEEVGRMEAEKKEMESNRLYRLETEKKELETRLQDIYSSDGYRLLSVYYRFKGKIFPEHSERLRKLKSIGGFVKGKNPFKRTAKAALIYPMR